MSDRPKNNEPYITPCETDFAYAAGIIDGEGNVAIRQKALRAGRRVRDINAEIIVSMTDREVLEWLQARWGGGIIKQNRSEKHSHWQDIYRWNLYSSRAAALLKGTLPYLIVKKPQALLAIEFQDFMEEWGGNRYHLGSKGFRVLPDEIIEKRLEYHKRMKILNLMGHGYDEREAYKKLLEKESQILATGLSTNDELDPCSDDDTEEEYEA
jgi:hypothetical protein